MIKVGLALLVFSGLVANSIANQEAATKLWEDDKQTEVGQHAVKLWSCRPGVTHATDEMKLKHYECRQKHPLVDNKEPYPTCNRACMWLSAGVIDSNGNPNNARLHELGAQMVDKDHQDTVDKRIKGFEDCHKTNPSNLGSPATMQGDCKGAQAFHKCLQEKLAAACPK